MKCKLNYDSSNCPIHKIHKCCWTCDHLDIKEMDISEYRKLIASDDESSEVIYETNVNVDNYPNDVVDDDDEDVNGKFFKISERLLDDAIDAAEGAVEFANFEGLDRPYYNKTLAQLKKLKDY